MKKRVAVASAVMLSAACIIPLAGCSQKQETVVLRVANWEEYIDLGGWDEDELIGIGDGIIGVNSMVDDFTEWFNSNPEFGFDVKVEYSTFGTNEDLYNRLSLGDVYDLVCPSDYMIMKLLAEDAVEPYSDRFLDGTDNYYTAGVSPYIDGVFKENGWYKYAACYMWGTTGLVYNPEKINGIEDVSSWDILVNKDYKRQVTVKDNVRDAYFAALGIINGEKLMSGGLDRGELSRIMNDTDGQAVAKAQDVLKAIKENVYSFETDAGKSDMVTGKVIANYQWSGDAVFIMDEAEDDANSTELWYSVPAECANLWFDGWVKLKKGIDGDERRNTAAEAFVNFLSRPENAVRNMYYIGYTSAIAGELVFDYMEWNYGAEDGQDSVDYDVSYFFGGESVLSAPTENFGFDNGEINRGRQLFAQYPPENVIDRSVVMLDFGDRLGDINRMWINVRCLDLLDISPVVVGVVGGITALSVAGILLYVFRYRLFINYKPKKGYEKLQNK